MGTESVPAGIEAQFNRWGTNYGLGSEEFDFELCVVRGGRIIESHEIDIRTLPNRDDLLARMPEEWRERFLSTAYMARAAT